MSKPLQATADQFSKEALGHTLPTLLLCHGYISAFPILQRYPVPLPFQSVAVGVPLGEERKGRIVPHHHFFMAYGKECVTRYNSTMFQRDVASKKLYTYYRYVFDGVKITDEVLEVSVEVRYLGDTPGKAYGSLCLYDTEHKWFLQNLSRADEKAIKAWIEQQS